MTVRTGERPAGSDEHEAAAASRREQRRLHHQELSRNQLLDAAEEVFGRKGFHDTSLKEIAELAEFSVGSVYSFFENKEDLFRQIFARRGAEYMPRMRAVTGAAVPAIEVLRALVDFEIGFFRDNPKFGRLYLRYSSATSVSSVRLADELVLDNYAESMRLQAEVFARGQREGSLCAGDPEVLARLLSGLVAAFQALDPAVTGEGPPGSERMALADFRSLVERTFVARASRRKP